MAQKVSPDQVQALSDNMRQMSELIGDQLKRLSKDLISLNDEVSRSYSEPYVQSASNKLSSLLGEMTSFTTLITGHIDAQAKGLKNAANSYRQTEQASKTTLKQPVSAPILNGQLSYNPKTVNSSVQKLQQRLKALGYDIEDDGKFGKQTLAAVNAYKNKYGLGNTGKDEGHVGKQTWLYLFGQLTGELRYDPNTYSDQVRMAQIRLKDLGYNVDVMGYFDGKTLTAVNKFKEDKKLGNTGKFEGVIGAQTWEVLFGPSMPNNSNTSSRAKSSNIQNDIISKAEKIIYMNEGNYDEVAVNDNGALSIGKIQWHASRARDLINRILTAQGIRASDTDYADKVKKYLPSSFVDDLVQHANSNKWWNTRVLTSSEQKAIAAFISTPIGKKVQEDQATEDIQVYIAIGKKLGITNEDALIYFADLINTSKPSTYKGFIQKIIDSKKPLTLDSIHEAALHDSIFGKYKGRRDTTYQKCKELTASSGIINHSNPSTPPMPTKPTQPSASTTPDLPPIEKSTNPKAINKLLDVVEKELDNGFKETNSDNKNPYGKWYGSDGVPWCAIFVSYCANQAGMMGTTIPRFAKVTLGEAWYAQENRFMKRESQYIPKAGDVIFFKNSKGQDHTGIVTGYDAKTNRVYTVEGNTGDRVARHYYTLNNKYIVGYGTNGGITSGTIPNDATKGTGERTR